MTYAMCSDKIFSSGRRLQVTNKPSATGKALMRLLLFCCLILSALCQRDVLHLNPKCTVFDDILSVKHDLAQRAILIELQPYRRCLNPTIMTRLSGPSLYLLDRGSNLHDRPQSKVTQYTDLLPNSTDVHSFRYPPPVEAGTYHVEVLILVCTSVNMESYADICLENVHEGRNILNLPYSFEVDSGSVRRPRWVHQNAFSSSYTSKLLPTRYQKHDCTDSLYCPQTDASLHNMYQWMDGPDWKVPFQQLQERNGVTAALPRIFICVVGASHSRNLRDNGNNALGEEGRKHIEFVYILATHPEHFHMAPIAADMCTFVVLGFGQWTHSFTEHRHPYTNSRSRKELARIIAEATLPVFGGSAQVFVRSLNYNGFGALHTVCPPVDHRQPHIVDAYNAMQRDLSAEHRVGYIDLTHIMGPLWDSAEDWNHPGERVFTAEAEQIMYTLFTAAVKSQRAIQAVKTEPARMVVRFEGESPVYLYQDGKMRQIPDRTTMLAMGFSESNVKALPSAEMDNFGLGAALPRLAS